MSKLSEEKRKTKAFHQFAIDLNVDFPIKTVYELEYYLILAFEAGYKSKEEMSE